MPVINNLVTAGKFFAIITVELILIFVAVSFIIGFLMEYLPPSRVRDFLANRLTWVQYVLGSGLGALTPFCSCSSVPITAGLLKGGVPFGPTMAFLFSSPVLNPVIVTLLLSLFGLKITVIYAIVTFLGSMVLAAILSRMGMERQVKPFIAFQAPSCCPEDARPEQAPVNTQPATAGCCASGLLSHSPLSIRQQGVVRPNRRIPRSRSGPPRAVLLVLTPLLVPPMFLSKRK